MKISVYFSASNEELEFDFPQADQIPLSNLLQALAAKNKPSSLNSVAFVKADGSDDAFETPDVIIYGGTVNGEVKLYAVPKQSKSGNYNDTSYNDLRRMLKERGLKASSGSPTRSELLMLLEADDKAKAKVTKSSVKKIEIAEIINEVDKPSKTKTSKKEVSEIVNDVATSNDLTQTDILAEIESLKARLEILEKTVVRVTPISSSSNNIAEAKIAQEVYKKYRKVS